MKHPAYGSFAIAALCLAGVLGLSAATETDPLLPSSTPAYPPGLLDELRAAAERLPGAAPLEVRYLTMAESHRSLADVLEDGSGEPYVLARTVFQVVYPDGRLMIDAGMDRQVHRFFGMGREEPYWQDRNDVVQAALRQAGLIVITHEHGDHVAGVVRSEHVEDIAPRTVLTKAQVETLTLAPQLPEIRLTPASAASYLVIDYALFFPVAPGVVLLKSPGHTPGHQMVYVRTAPGAEYLFIGDVAWALAGVTEQRQKPPAQSERIREDREALAHQIRWLKAAADAGVVVVPSHDPARLTSLEQQGLLQQGLVTD